jgi:hypothetical protein
MFDAWVEERSISLLAPVHSSPKDGAIPKEEFAIDLETTPSPARREHDADLQAESESAERER